MAAAFATLLTLLAVQQVGRIRNCFADSSAAVLAGDLSWGHHHHKSPTVVEVVRYGQACPCAKTLPFELEVPVKPKDPALHTYGYAIEAPPPREPLPLYSYDYELEVPVKKHPPIKRTYGYEVQAPPARERLPLYSYDYELEVPARSPDPPKLHNLETRLERVLLPKHDCPWHAQADALLRSPRGLVHGRGWGRGDGYGLVEPDEEAGAGRVVPLAGPTRILSTSGPALAPREEFYDSGKTYEVVHSSPLALISGGDGGRLGFYPEDLAGLTKPWSPLPGPAYLAGSVLGRDFRSDLHFAPERPRIQDEPAAGRYVVNRPCHG
ncbi:uncharacterized protein LOC126203493 [Schistocerca nitens]|uniref:uncharacterized protein LOC126203493 n=1 Tax=Schistocerca nitens TaxID=7011 RepID=UPI0021191875|nr:uncharacterized protein LOC126203493 [Schistocerca nitens]